MHGVTNVTLFFLFPAVSDRMWRLKLGVASHSERTLLPSNEHLILLLITFLVLYIAIVHIGTFGGGLSNRVGTSGVADSL